MIAIAPGETHAYVVPAPPGAFLDLAVEQRGSDVVLRLVGPDGRCRTVVDSPTGRRGRETLQLVGEPGGPFLLEIQAAADSPAGSYAVEVAASRPATARDRARVAAERLFAEGEALRRRGDGRSLAAAVALYSESLGRFRSLGELRRQALALDRLTGLSQDRGEGQEALAWGKRFVATARATGDGSLVARALNQLGKLERNRGRAAVASERFREAITLQHAAGDPEVEAGSWLLLGRAHADLGEVEGALAAWERARLLLRRPGGQTAEAQIAEGDILSNLGRLHLYLGNAERASRSFGAALALLAGAGDRKERLRAGALVDFGVALGESGRLRTAGIVLRSARRTYRALGNRHGEALATLALARLEGRLGHGALARAACREAVDFFLARNYRGHAAGALVHLGALESAEGRTAAAEDAFGRALALFEASGDRLGVASALAGLARVHRGRGDLAQALEESERSLANLDALRRAPLSLDQRTAFFASRQEPYEQHLLILMDLDRMEPAAGWAGRALETSERARARSFLDALADAGAAGLRRGSPQLLARQNRVDRRLAAAEARSAAAEAAGVPAGEREAAEAELARRLDEAEEMRAAIRRANWRAGEPPEARPASLAEIRQQAIDPQTLLLEVALGERGSFLYAVSRDSLAAFPLPPRPAIEGLAREVARRAAAAGSTLGQGGAEAALAELSRMLFTPRSMGLVARYRKVLVVPDGALFAVPWAALPALAERAVATLPSASVGVALRRRAVIRRPPPGSLAVIADPVLDAGDPRAAGGAAGAGRALSSPPRLAHAGAEARAILALAPPDAWSAVGFAASKETVESGVLSRYRIVHFATHGVLDAAHPDLSGVLLSRLDPAGRPLDGFLRTHEIYRLHLPADLVVLSACETALGREIRGEGLVGLARALFYAGAQQILVSLWPVDDEATAELMSRFYRGLLGAGLTPAAALRAAQDSLRRERRWEEPHYWAGFTLQGDL